MTPILSREDLVERIARAGFYGWGCYDLDEYPEARSIWERTAKAIVAAIHDTGLAVVPREPPTCLGAYPISEGNYRSVIAAADLAKEDG